jgi:hypothetical protein
MQFAPELGGIWREQCSSKLTELGYYPINITALDKAYATRHGDLYRNVGDHDDLLIRKSNIRKHFVETDINLIHHHSDAVVIYYDHSVRVGAGTISEIHDAYMNDIPVFLVNGYDSLSEVPGWMQAETVRMFQTFDELYEYLSELPPGILKRDIYGNRRSGSHYLCSMCGAVEEKHKVHFVSKVTPQYCRRCVEIVRTTYEQHKDRYEFFLEQLQGVK